LDVIKYLLDAGADVNIKHQNSKTAIFIASDPKKVEDIDSVIIKLLLDYKADVNVTSSSIQLTPLHLFSWRGEFEMTELLINHNADVNAIGSDDSTPFGAACNSRHLDIMTLLLNNGVDLKTKRGKNCFWSGEAIRLAITEHDDEFLKLILDKSDVKLVDESSDHTLLHVAIQEKRPDVIKLLIEKGASVNKPNFSSGISPLCAAINGDRLSCFETLIENGADVNGDSDGWSPLHYAANSGRLEMLRILVEHRADVNMKKKAWTPLYALVKRGSRSVSEETYLKMVKILVENGANVNSGPYKETPFYTASFQNHLYVSKYLMECGANISGRDLKTTVDATKMIWSTNTHHLYSLDTRRKIRTLMILKMKGCGAIGDLSWEVVFYLFRFLSVWVFE
jgi:ankyrin repeat protein